MEEREVARTNKQERNELGTRKRKEGSKQKKIRKEVNQVQVTEGRKGKMEEGRQKTKKKETNRINQEFKDRREKAIRKGRQDSPKEG